MGILFCRITDKEDAAVQREIQAQVDSLPERKRRTFYRYVEREQNGASDCKCCDHDDDHEQCEHSHSHSKRGNATQLLEKLKLNEEQSDKRRHGTSSCDDDDDDDDFDDEDCSDDDDDEDGSDEQ